jgi:predicted RND superfamily exporter protein
MEKLGAQGLLFDEPTRIRKSFDEVKRFIPLVKLWAEKPNVLERVLGETPLERFITGLGTQKPDTQTHAFVALLADSWNQTLRSGEVHLPDLNALDATDPSRLGYYYVPDDSDPSRRVLLVRIYHREDYSSLTAVSETVESIRAAVREVAKDYPDFAVGVTGRPALEADEMRTTDRDSHRAEVLALSVVFVGVALMLRSLWLALAGEIALGVGIGWTFGWATLTVGELNLLSIVFLLALIGIGMDYLVQVLTRFRMEFKRRAHPRTIWIGVFRHVAAPINTACMGAAGAFLVSLLTDFRGAAELGLIAGGGLMLCLLAGYVILPAILTLLPPRIRRRGSDAFFAHLGPPARGDARNFIAPVVWLVMLAVGVPLALRTGFDPGLLSLQSPKLESVRLVRKLETWSSVVLAKDLETLRRARDAVQSSPVVSHTESILTAYDNLAWLKQHERELPEVSWTAPAPVDPNDLARLAQKARGLSERFNGVKSLITFGELVSQSTGTAPQQIAQRLSDWQNGFVEQLRQTLAQFHPQSLEIDKLPPELHGHLVGTDGTFALYTYPVQDLWQQQHLAQFVQETESRLSGVGGDFTLTGIAMNIYHSTASIRRSFHRATLYALTLILILVFIDLRRVGQTLAAVSVLALGLPMLVAMMGLFKIDWNFANFFGLPILIGAGHEYGVFLVHRYRESLHDPRRVWRRWDVSDKALLLCAFITCTAFGFFGLLAHHRGLRSLGIVMSMGTACIYLAAILVLRPLLIWNLSRKRGGQAPARATAATNRPRETNDALHSARSE